MLFKKLFSNTIFLLIARILYRVFNALVAIIVARYLGVEKFGVYSTALAVVNTFLVSNDIGSTTLLLREGSRDKDKIGLYFGNSIIIQLIASAGFFALALIMGFVLGYDATTMLLVVILGSATVIFEFRKSFRSVLRILLKLKVLSLFEIGAGFGVFSATYLISKFVFDQDLGFYLIACVPLFFNFLFIITVFFYDLKFVKPKYSWKMLWPMIKDGYIYSLYNIFYIVYFQISILMVQAMRGDVEAGLYSAASKLVILLLIIPQMIFQVALPLMFKYSKDNLDKYKRIHKIIFRYLNAFGLPVAVGMWFLSRPIIQLVYKGEDFLLASGALKIFAIFIIARFLGNVAGQSLTTLDKQKQKVIVQAVSLAVLFILNYFWINSYGFLGAILGTVAVEIIIRISFMLMDFKYLNLSLISYVKDLLPMTGAVIIMGLMLFFTKTDLNVILNVLLGAILYGLCLWIFRFFKEYDLKLFKQLLPNKLKKNK